MTQWPNRGTSAADDTFTPLIDGPLAERNAAPRVRQAADADTSPSLMRKLACDPDIIVRAAVAINGACSPEITSLLAKDKDERIRALLGARIARLLPSLDHRGREDAAIHIEATLGALARDQATRVRAAIADELKTMHAAPHELVLLLARDEAIEVSDPLIRLSPVLTDADLLALLATPPHPATARSIACRPELSATVADAIVAYSDAPAIRTLLSNQSAAIQEATLDGLIGRAPDHPDWHGPLCRRPSLSAKAVKALCEFLAADLLRDLAARTDLDATKLESVRQRLALHTGGADERTLVADGLKLKAASALTEVALLDAARAGDPRRVVALLAVAGGVPMQTIDRVVDLRSAKAIVSLTWFCGFSMRVAMAVQTIVGQLGPDAILPPAENGDFPLSKEEMEWQMELMNNQCYDKVHTGPSWSGRSLRHPS